MKRLTRLQRMLLGLITFFIVFGSIMLGLRQNALSNVGYSAWTYIKYGLVYYPLDSVMNATNDLSNLWHVYTDNTYLKEQLANQRSYQTLYEEERNRNSELENLIDMKNALGQAPSVAATVLNRSADTWNESFTISAGSKQGISPNMLVMTSYGAVGLVREVQTSTSTVDLLTSDDLQNDIAIQISLDDGTSVEGVLKDYDAKKKAYQVSLFDTDKTISKGQLVSTSGKGGNYPSGILVGTVIDSQNEDDAIVSTIYVKPISNIGSFDYVLVVGSGAV